MEARSSEKSRKVTIKNPNILEEWKGYPKLLEISRQCLLLQTVKCYRKKLLGALENNKWICKSWYLSLKDTINISTLRVASD